MIYLSPQIERQKDTEKVIDKQAIVKDELLYPAFVRKREGFFSLSKFSHIQKNYKLRFYNFSYWSKGNTGLRNSPAQQFQQTNTHHNIFHRIAPLEASKQAKQHRECQELTEYSIRRDN